MSDLLSPPERAAVLALATQEQDHPITILRRECEALVAKGLAEHWPERWISKGEWWNRIEREYFALTAAGDVAAQILIEKNRYELGDLLNFYA
jgi:hypothetical protein